MGWVQKRVCSSVGMKFLMAITGLGLLGFLLGHLVGNLLIFQGQEAINQYAKNLRELPFGLLYIVRIGLGLCFFAHVFTAITLQQKNKAARPIGYKKKATIQANLASRTMVYSGLVILAYIGFHLSHFTWHQIHPAPYLPDGSVDVYSMVIEGFRQPFLSVLYVVALLTLGLHLSHGIRSVFQTFGLYHVKYNCLWEATGLVLGWGIPLAYLSIPASVWFGLLK